jgi:hypothetical protein
MAFRAKDYPPHWKELRAACLKRDEYRCVKCHVKDQSRGAWDKEGNWHYEYQIKFMRFYIAAELYGTYPRMRKIVLTCHHKCREKMCDDLDHLESLCQRCHLIEERPTAIEGRRRKRMERLQARV